MLIDQYRASMVPAGKEHAADVLTALSAHFWQANRPAEQMAAVIYDMAEDLAEYPADILDDAGRDWRRSQTWFPKPAEFRKLCDAPMNERKSMHSKLMVMLEKREGKRRVEPDDGLPKTEAERERVAWGLKRLGEIMGSGMPKADAGQAFDDMRREFFRLKAEAGK